MSETSKRYRAGLLRSAIPGLILSFMAVSAAQAQIETVVVTAQKRAENVQSVPIAITAFTGTTLQDKNINTLHGLSSLTPNVNLDGGAPFSGDSSVLSASIRGIGQDDFAFNLDPGVGVYLDGVYLARTIGANVDLLDVSRIEILKGPQGTLFGRNTIGGAISIVTRDPGDAFMLEGRATVGSLARHDFDVTADIPLTNNLRSSLTFSSVQRDGYQKVIPYDNVNGYNFDPMSPDRAAAREGISGAETHDHFGGENRQSARGKLLWTPRTDVTVTLVADWTRQDQEATPNTVLQTFPDTPGSFPTPYAPNGSIALLYTLCLDGYQDHQIGPTGPDFDTLCNLPRATGWHNGAPVGPGLPMLHNSNLLPIDPSTTQTGNIDTTYANGPNYAKFDSEGVGLTSAWVLNDSMTLKSITGYRHITWSIGIDLDGSADHGNLLTVTDKQQQQQFSEELQLIGTAMDSRLNYVAGLYYFYENGFVHDWVPFDGDLLAVDDSGLNLVRTSNYAAFAHVDYKVTDRLGLSLGARYSVEDKFFVGGQQDLNGLTYHVTGCFPPEAPSTLIGGPPFLTCQQLFGFPDPNNPFLYFPAGTNHQTFDAFTPTASVQYHVNDDAMLYASWSKGTKSGGWTTRLSAVLPNNDPTQAEFKPEKAQTTEIGLKSEWLDHRLQANLAGFYTQYTGIQLNEQQGASPVLKNLGDGIILGSELEVQAVLGGGFNVRGAAGYLDARYTKLDPSVFSLDPIESITLKTKFPKTPMWKFNINPEWDHDLGNDMALQLQASYTHTSSLYNDSQNTPLLKRPSLDLIDLSAQMSFADGKYSVQIGGTNITDERYITEGSHNYAAGFVDASYNPPGQWYATVRLKY
jgi:iron complex outermembrane receptor protein